MLKYSFLFKNRLGQEWREEVEADGMYNAYQNASLLANVKAEESQTQVSFWLPQDPNRVTETVDYSQLIPVTEPAV